MNEFEIKPIVFVSYMVSVALAGGSIGYSIAPEEVVVEKEVEVEKKIELPATNQDIYDNCLRRAQATLYSSWNGHPLEGTTPQVTQDFIDDCFSKLTDDKQQ